MVSPQFPIYISILKKKHLHLFINLNNKSTIYCEDSETSCRFMYNLYINTVHKLFIQKNKMNYKEQETSKAYTPELHELL